MSKWIQDKTETWAIDHFLNNFSAAARVMTKEGLDHVPLKAKWRGASRRQSGYWGIYLYCSALSAERLWFGFLMSRDPQEPAMCCALAPVERAMVDRLGIRNDLPDWCKEQVWPWGGLLVKPCEQTYTVEFCLKQCILYLKKLCPKDCRG
jgi:hypothetical protein